MHLKAQKGLFSLDGNTQHMPVKTAQQSFKFSNYNIFWSVIMGVKYP